MSPDPFRTKTIPLLFFLVFCVFSIARFLSQITLTPDSTGYISAAQNFIRTGSMFHYANSPSWTLVPAIEPYTEQPPGFPLFLVPFLLIFKQPITAAAVAQSFAIVLLYSAVYALTQDFGAKPFFQIVCGLVVTLFWPLQYVFANVISETLFIALTLWSIHFLVAAQYRRKWRYYWLLALVCAAAASLTRMVGLLMLGVFILASWMRGKSRSISIATSVLFVVGPVIAWFVRNKVLYGSTSVTHTLYDHLAWDKLFLELVFILDSTSRNAFVILFIAVFGLLCLAAPFIGPLHLRVNKITIKRSSSKISPFTILLTILGAAVAVTALAADRLGFGGDPEIGLKQLVIASLGIMVVLAAWLKNTNIFEYVRTWKENYDWNRWKTKPFYTFGIIFLAGLSHFIGITALSVVTPFSDLTDRLLSPSLTLLLLSGLLGMYYLINIIPARFFSVPVYGIGLVLILLSPFFLTTGIGFQPRIHIPPEQALWKEIYALPGIGKATHFYSDYDFTHEIFVSMPQRIILIEDQIDEKGFLSNILAFGQCPFVLVRQGDKMNELMDLHYEEANLIRLEMMQGQFILYAQPCLLSP
jgi:hypothetical protein